MMPPNEQESSFPKTPSISQSVTNPVQETRFSSPSHVIPCHDDHYDGPSHQSRQSSVLRQSLRPIILKFEELTYSIKSQTGKRSYWIGTQEPKPNRFVLNGVSGIVKPGELLAMLGPSGSGKTTLVTALAGRLHGKLSGTVTYNGEQFTSSVKRKTGFVTQEDVLYPHLTVMETLTYTALLRLPKELTRKEKIEQAETVVSDLGLTRCSNSVIGGGLVRGISGGERKRVSIGQEMLVNPSLLLLDEPTSGLDSTTAARIVATLRTLARGGRTVVTTIHQPSSRLYRMFDKVLVLSEGSPIYSGDSGRVIEYFGSIGFQPGSSFINPADFVLDLANGITSDTKQYDQIDINGRLDRLEEQNSVKQSLILSYKKILYPPLKEDVSRTYPQDQTFNGSRAKSLTNRWPTSWWMQFSVLLKRGLKERSHESFSGLRIFMVMSVSLLSGLLWWHSRVAHIQDQVGLLFFFSIFWGFFPLFNAIFTFPQERPMLIKERSSGIYRLSSYYLARIVGDLPMELILPTIFVTITYWMGGLKPSLTTFLLTLMIVLYNVLVAQGVGLALGAILMDAKKAATLSSVLMLVFLLAGGYYIQHIPGFIAWLKYISFSHYCYKLLVGVQYTWDEVYECGPGLHCSVMDYEGIKNLGIGNMIWDVLALALMLFLYRVLAYLALRNL
ncbi:ABC transporter G family member 21 [Raphanus sativus]|uniref:ABC transporter G family member 21 n=1 Tax=Raphanus sativus TaxID=3726 RepID=A0A6J0MXF4_RAPSA|nr:ABC transporter G family member 21 [Raphanus sativus]KAJ4901149.1 ABC transporter G family member 21 [Raphanus sativus]